VAPLRRLVQRRHRRRVERGVTGLGEGVEAGRMQGALGGTARGGPLLLGAQQSTQRRHGRLGRLVTAVHPGHVTVDVEVRTDGFDQLGDAVGVLGLQGGQSLGEHACPAGSRVQAGTVARQLGVERDQLRLEPLQLDRG
jgi:hypothetical protein